MKLGILGTGYVATTLGGAWRRIETAPGPEHYLVLFAKLAAVLKTEPSTSA